MPSHPRYLADNFQKKLKSLEKIRLKVDTLHQSKAINNLEKKQFYEGLFLKTHVLFESFIEDLFYGLLVENSAIKTPYTVVPRVQFKSHKLAREFVTGKNKYVDWIPFSKTTDLAKIFFRGGKPFTNISSNDIDLMNQCHYIRNAIAHESNHSIQKFERHVIQSKTLPMTERNPAGFLIGVFRRRPAQTRFENYSGRLLQIAYILTK